MGDQAMLAGEAVTIAGFIDHGDQFGSMVDVFSHRFSFQVELVGKHQNPWGQRSRYRRLNVQTPTSNAPLPFQTEDGWPFDPTDFDASPKERREEIADRLHSPPHGPRATLGRTAAEHAAVVLDRYLVDVSRRSFGQCAPPQRPLDPQPGEPDGELRAWREATQAAAETWRQKTPQITDALLAVITRADVVTLRERRREAAAAHLGVRPKGKARD